MKILSINLCSWGDGDKAIPARQPRVKALIDKYDPDLIGTQECLELWSELFASQLSRYGRAGFGREENKSGEASAIFYKKDKFEKLEEETFWLSETPYQLSKGWDGGCRRVCTRARLKRLEDGFVFEMFDVHLDNTGVIAQKKGAEMVNEHIIKSEFPVILTGDFNVQMDSDAYRAITIDSARSIAPETDNGGTYHLFGELDGKEEFIDHCFVRGFEVESFKVLRDRPDGKFISDHYPIMTVVND